MQYNFGYDVDGGLIEIIVLSDFSFFQEDAVARYNIGVDVGFRNKENSAGIMFSGRVTRSKVYNNTIVTTDLHPSYKAIAVNNWGGEWPDNNAIHNNLFLATGSPSTFNDMSRLTQLGNVLSHNLYHGNISVPTADKSAVTGDPLLMKPDALVPADIKLRAGSPAIAAGLTIADNGGRDFFDNPLPVDLVPSIGAHEFQTEGMGRWAGYKIGETGYVDTGAGFLGWIWVGADGNGISNWMYSVAAGQWVYLPENYISAGAGAWCYLYNSAALSPTDIRGEWFFAQAFPTWVASYGETVGSGSAWIYALDLSGSQ